MNISTTYPLLITIATVLGLFLWLRSQVRIYDQKIFFNQSKTELYRKDNVWLEKELIQRKAEGKNTKNVKDQIIKNNESITELISERNKIGLFW